MWYRTLRPVLVLPLVVLFMPSGVQSQSMICNDRDNTIETCEDGFTCAYSFTGGERFERFTMRVIESGNPTGEMSIIVFFNGDPRTVREGVTKEGEILSWTKRSDGEGESFFRVANTNSSSDIVVRFSCAQADTELTDPSDVGDDALNVLDMTPFAVGDSIIVDPGGPSEEENVVVGFGSLLLKTPLQFAHAAGETVISTGNGPINTASEPTAEVPSGFSLSAAYPNPFNPGATLTLSQRTAQAVTVTVFDALGKPVATLQDGPLGAGEHTLRFDAADLPSGVYLVRAVSPSGVVTQRVTLVR